CPKESLAVPSVISLPEELAKSVRPQSGPARNQKMNYDPAPPAIVPPSDLATICQQIVSAGHILTDFGILDAFGHVSARHPEKPDRFLMTKRVAPGQAIVEDVHEFGFDGELA